MSVRFFSSVIKNMEKHEVVPDVIDSAPKEVVEVQFSHIYTLRYIR